MTRFFHNKLYYIKNTHSYSCTCSFIRFHHKRAVKKREPVLYAVKAGCIMHFLFCIKSNAIIAYFNSDIVFFTLELNASFAGARMLNDIIYQLLDNAKNKSF